MRFDRSVVLILALSWMLFAAIVYLPDVGRGFIKDDFTWVRAGERALDAPLSVLTADSTGTFYRPVVTLSFASDYALYGLSPRGYGVTNLMLYATTVVVLFFLFRVLGVSVAGASIGSFVWAINPHGIDMGLLWLSGRTSLLMTLFACASVLAFLHRRPIVGLALFAFALLAKEDALALPLVVAVCLAARGRDWRSIAMEVAAMAAVIAGYFVLRGQTHAITAATAPSFYQLTWSPRLILANALQYLDRGATAATIITLAAMALYRSGPALSKEDKQLLGVAVVWFAAGLAITIRVPVRSSLYIVFSSVASALACAVIIEAVRRRAPQPSHDRRLPLALAALILLLIPMYKARNSRWVEPARISDQTVQLLVAQLDNLPDRGTLVFEDEAVRFSNLSDAFGGAATDAVQLYARRPLDASIVPAGETTRHEGEVARFRLAGGEISRVY